MANQIPNILKPTTWIYKTHYWSGWRSKPRKAKQSKAHPSRYTRARARARARTRIAPPVHHQAGAAQNLRVPLAHHGLLLRRRRRRRAPAHHLPPLRLRRLRRRRGRRRRRRRVRRVRLLRRGGRRGCGRGDHRRVRRGPDPPRLRGLLALAVLPRARAQRRRRPDPAAAHRDAGGGHPPPRVAEVSTAGSGSDLLRDAPFCCMYTC